MCRNAWPGMIAPSVTDRESTAHGKPAKICGDSRCRSPENVRLSDLGCDYGRAGKGVKNLLRKRRMCNGKVGELRKSQNPCPFEHAQSRDSHVSQHRRDPSTALRAGVGHPISSSHPDEVFRFVDLYAPGWMRRITAKDTADTNAAAGMVKIQAHTMRVATPQRTAERRWVAPTPTMAPVMV